MTLRSAIRLLLGSVFGLALLQAVLVWVAGLLRAMGDEAAATVVARVSTAAGVMWLVVIVGLVIALAIEALDRPPPE
jgi:hypothetical protein